MTEIAKANPAVCIAGAHRSGTSMVTRLLHLCGLNLGPESDLMPARADNPDGFWENLRFVAINDEVLNELGGGWDLPPRLDEGFASDRFDPLRSKARFLIESFDPASTWGWKDPRNSLTLPFWQELQPALKILVIVRNPLEVAYSMRERNSTSYAFGLRLWEIYNRRVIEATSPEERLVARYDSFFENPEAELSRIADFVGLPSSELSRAAGLVNTEKRHTHFTMEQLLDTRVSEKIIDLYQGLVTEAGGFASRPTAADRRQSAAKASPRKTPAVHEQRKSDEEEMLPGAVSRLNVSIPDAEPVRRELAKLRGSRIELGRIRARFVQTSISLSASEARVAELSASLRRQLQATKRLGRLLGDVEEAAARLRSSRRWKMANPFAALKAFLSRGREVPGYGHLEKIVAAYHKWRSAHPEVANIDEEIQALLTGPNSGFPQFPGNDASPRHFEPPVSTEPIHFEVHQEVEVSIVVPVFNQLQLTQACLASIQEHQSAISFEVIVVDDCSTDATPDLIRKIPGVVYLRNDANSGFIASCNRGAAKARGKYLLFLNNDTFVTSGWLSELVETFENEPEAGLVGSKLIFPEGRLQEAGTIIWRDGSGWNRGKFDDPWKPEYNFLREVDYCSAACLMIPKSIFESVGGFDSKYAPAYYEDVDLAFKVRRRGNKVFYQPLSQVIHYEGATGGTDISSGTKKYQEINRATFVNSWAEVLAEKPSNGDVASCERPKPGKKQVLVIDHHLPMPEKDAGSLRMAHILKILHRLGHHVTFLPDNVARISPYAEELQKRGIEIVYHPYIKSVGDYLRTNGSRFDAVLLSRSDFARKHIADVRHYAPQARIIFDTVDLHFLRQKRGAQLTRDAEAERQALAKQEEEFSLIDEADETWVVSTAEQKFLRGERPLKSIEIVSTIVDTPGSAMPFSLRSDMLFIGSFQHTPNVDAVIFFTQEIFPLLRDRLDDVRFYIIGDKPPPSVVSLASENIIVTGLQPDIQPYFESAKLSVAPLRWGAGVKGKINLSMGFGVPVVATSIAVEGMGLTHREDILVADEPRDFAQAIIELYQSEELWNRISKSSVEKTKEFFSPEAAGKQLARLFSDRHMSAPTTTRTSSKDAMPSERSSNGDHAARASLHS